MAPFEAWSELPRTILLLDFSHLRAKGIDMLCPTPDASKMLISGRLPPTLSLTMTTIRLFWLLFCATVLKKAPLWQRVRVLYDWARVGRFFCRLAWESEPQKALRAFVGGL
jgi:hypothetical protein